MVLARQHLLDLAYGQNPMILADGGIEKDQIQIASFDCRLGDKVYAMKSAALPRGESVADLIRGYKRYDFSLSADSTNVLERGVCYLIPLRECLCLSEELKVVFSPKSSTGRCDVFVRVICDGYPYYDRTNYGYNGSLYLEVIPLSFNVRINADLKLTQGRVIPRNSKRLSSEEVAVLHARHGILRRNDGTPVSHEHLQITDGGLFYHIDLDRQIVGFEAISSPVEELDLTKEEVHEPDDFWRPIFRPKNGQLVLSPGMFYLLATAERTVIPPEVCGEILPYDISAGEFRPHYAGFFDNGFGGEKGTVGVLEVRCRDVPFRVVHGQSICHMVYHRTLEVPSELYDGHYNQSGPSLSKHFKNRFKIWGSC